VRQLEISSGEAVAEVWKAEQRRRHLPLSGSLAPMARVIVGAALLAAGIVAFIEAHSHRPLPSIDITKRFKGDELLGVLNLYSRDSRWSRTAYDFAHIGGAVLIVVAALLMMIGLVALARRTA
jgi:hypothetical protein